MKKIELTNKQIQKAIDSPALEYRSEMYPKRYNDKVPFIVKMSKTVTSDLPIVIRKKDDDLIACNEKIYPVWVNSHGAVAAIFPDGNTLGLKPDEFEVTEYHS